MADLDLSDKKIAILGFGEEGRSAYSFLKPQAGSIVVFDEDPSLKTELDSDELVISDKDDWDLKDFDMIVRSPSINPDSILQSEKVTSVTNLFFDLCPAKIIGVTGTKGKGTTSTLIAKILEQDGRKVHLLGNIGHPSLDGIDKISKKDLVVYELSSFQLWDMHKSPQIAVVLMIEPEHLDVHSDLDEYVGAKSNISEFQKEQDVCIYHPFNELSKKVASRGEGKKIKFMDNETARISFGDLYYGNQKIMPVEEFGLIGPHNRENICAAVTAVFQITENLEAIRSAVNSFTGLEHRLELVEVIDGVRFYNDSFATIPGATIAAIESFDQPQIIILGGSDKKSDYSDLAEAIASSNNIKQVILIGEMAGQIKKDLSEFGFEKTTEVDGGMVEIVRQAKELSDEGDVVLLSPACASFDMFSSYKDRGQQFKKAVRG